MNSQFNAVLRHLILQECAKDMFKLRVLSRNLLNNPLNNSRMKIYWNIDGDAKLKKISFNSLYIKEGSLCLLYKET